MLRMRIRDLQMSATLLLFGLLLASADIASAQVVLTESFELPNTANFQTFNSGQTLVGASASWSITTSGIDLFEDAARPEAAVFDGTQAIDLAGSPGAGVLETSFTTVLGATYELVFHYARNNLLGSSIGDAQVDVVGTTSRLQATVQHDPVVQAFNVFRTFTQTFTADSTTTTLRFTSLEAGNAGVVLDGIQVERVSAVPLLSLEGRGVLIAILLSVGVLMGGAAVGLRRRSGRTLA